MTWTKIDDQAHAHPKVRDAWQADGRALGMQFLALSYAGAYLTDGHVPAGFVAEKIPVQRDRERITGVLVAAGLWDKADGGWQIHDYLDLNPSRVDVEAKREADRKRKGRGAAS